MAGMLSFQASSPGAISRTVLSRVAAMVVELDDYAEAVGFHDNTEAFINAFAALGSRGGTVRLGRRQYYTAAGFVVPEGCHLAYDMPIRGPGGTNSIEPFDAWGGTIFINSGASIVIKSGAGISGVIILRAGITAPVVDPTTFTGTGVRVEGDDAFVVGCCVFGFNLGIASDDHSRLRLYDLYLDNTNGMRVTDSTDTTRIRSIQCWPFTTIAHSAAGGPASCLRRRGAGLILDGKNDNTVITDILALGYKTGVSVSGQFDGTMAGIWIDAMPPDMEDSAGITLNGLVSHLLIHDLKTFSIAQGVCAHMDTGSYVEIERMEVSGATDCGLSSDGGTIRLGHLSYVSSSGPAVSIASRIDAFSFEELRLRSGNATPLRTFGTFAPGVVRYGRILTDEGPLSYLGNPFSAGGVASSALVTIPSAAILSLPMSEDEVFVSGSTDISLVAGGVVRRRVTLIFTGALTVLNGWGANNIALHGSANWAARTGSTLSLVYDGGIWRELCHMDA